MFEYWQQLLGESAHSLWLSALKALPSLLGALALLLLGWLLARGTRLLVSRLLRKTHVDDMSSKAGLGSIMDSVGSRENLSDLVGRLSYWVVNLLFVVAALEVMGLHEVSQEVKSWISYLPKLLSALLVFVIGLYMARFVRDFFRGAAASLGFLGGKLLGQLSFYLIVIVVALTALGQAGIDTTLITSQLSLAVGAMLLTMGVSYGFASKDILTNILSSFYGRRIFREGQIIELENGDGGKIIEMGSLHVRIKTDEGEMVIPQSQLLNGRVKIKKEKSDWE